ncbi:inovirus Gp2 family protein [Tolumonas osonensis]|uniref:YagK/YfjJ C-terminal domain-containing protein n=1 Tax=Tolumonas osonensis TaxID=675874 RepID=A0A841GKQ8_9GAMM|nr:inovirus Gp2 family protein [Tolumonas osonensis]MBB6055380.1 hypothetical protein [Tolumonas osonensis]
MPELNNNHGVLNRTYINKIMTTIDKAVIEFPRTMALRVDLRMPYIPDRNDHFDVDSPVHDLNTSNEVISRFIDSLKSQIKADLKRKKNQGSRVHPCRLRYCWVRELGENNEQLHYHALLLFNKDAYAFLGDFDSNRSHRNMMSKIRKAWASALRGEYEECEYLVHVPVKPIYYLDSNNINYMDVYSKLIFRVSYLAKYKTKPYGDGYRSFGCSQY